MAARQDAFRVETALSAWSWASRSVLSCDLARTIAALSARAVADTWSLVAETTARAWSAVLSAPATVVADVIRSRPASCARRLASACSSVCSA